MPPPTIKTKGVVMREITGHRPGKVLIAVMAVSAICYVFILPFALQGREVLLFGWMPLAVFCYNLMTLLWAVSFWIYTTRYWPYR